MEHFLESLKKLKKPSTHSNPEDVDPLFCRYNKGWNDATVIAELLMQNHHYMIETMIIHGGLVLIA